jgi:hypothetical protein
MGIKWSTKEGVLCMENKILRFLKIMSGLCCWDSGSKHLFKNTGGTVQNRWLGLANGVWVMIYYLLNNDSRAFFPFVCKKFRHIIN